MRSSLLIPILSLVLYATASVPAPYSTDVEPCMQGPLAQFGRYLGDWRIDDQELASDGSGWGPGHGERWTFECVGNGTAVQDYWLPDSGGFGTNLRTYNPNTGKWEIVWAATNLNGLMHISAELDDEGSIVMQVLSPKSGPMRRIIFYAPDDEGWNWVQQWSRDEGETWTDVYRIRATPW